MIPIYFYLFKLMYYDLSPASGLGNSLVDHPSHLLGILHIKRHHMLHTMIVERHLRRFTEIGKLHALGVERVQLADDVRRRDTN